MYWKQKHSENDYLNRREVLNLSKPVSSMLELLKLILIMIFVLHFTFDYGFLSENIAINHSVSGSWLELYNIEHETFLF